MVIAVYGEQVGYEIRLALDNMIVAGTITVESQARSRKEHLQRL